MKQLLILLTAVALPIMALNTGWCQENESRHEFSYGNLISISKNQITVSEYDYDTDEDTVSFYIINQMTKFGKNSGLNVLQADDAVEITYYQEGSRKIAVMISKDNESSEDIEDTDDIEEYDEDTEYDEYGDQEDTRD